MKVSITDLLLFAIAGYIIYYVYALQNQNNELESIIDSQNSVLETQRIYIIEVNKMLGINPYLYEQYQPKDSPIHRRQV